MKKWLLVFLIGFNVYAQDDLSMRKCMLLPITDSVDGAIGFKVFEQVETYIKDSSWCYYHHNSEIINILKNYKKNLHAHLHEKEVLKLIADKVKAGSLIRVEIKSGIKGANVKLEVIGSNGRDLFFQEETQLENDDVDRMAQTVNNWLEVYSKQIPYDGRVTGILGEQVTIDIGKSSLVRIGNQVKIVRPIRKKKHPLLKEVVAWESELLAVGQIYNVSEFQAFAKVKSINPAKTLKLSDWVRIDRSTQASQQNVEQDFKRVDPNSFGKLGTLDIALRLGSGSASNTVSSTNKKIGSMTFGLDFKGELYISRHWWASAEVGRDFGSYKQKEGTVSLASNSASIGKVKVKAGYRYLPYGFFYGPQVNAYLGYANLSYNLDTATTDSFGAADFTGLLIGIRGEAPLYKLFRMHAALDWIPSPSYEEDVTIFGEASSQSSFTMELGFTFNYSPSMSLFGAVEAMQSRAKFDASTSEISFKNTTLKFGASFIY